MDADRLDVWMRWEYDRLNAGVVARTRSLRALLEEPRPRVQARDGTDVEFDRSALEAMAAVCTEDERGQLRLPVTVRFPADVEDSAYLTDELASAILRRIEGWGEAYPYRDGRMWLPRSLAVDLILRYGGTIQRLFL